MMHRWFFLSLLIMMAGLMPLQMLGQVCSPPMGFVDLPRPAFAPENELASHTEEITVNRPLTVVMQTAEETSLKKAIQKRGNLPTVTGDHPLNAIPFVTPGARRLVCLSDESTLEEQVLDAQSTSTSNLFRYMVWNYTTKQARPIEYGIGEFRHTQVDATHTHVVWTYSFKLKTNEFPGDLGALGRLLFHWAFLDRSYAEMMRATLAAGKANAEKLSAIGH